jgi:PAS domain S-box-containing protein
MIKDRNKTKEHLIEELNALRKRVAELEILEIESGQELDAGQSRGQDYFRMLVESSLDAFVVLNRDLTVRYESPAIDQLLGVKYDERIGKSPFEFIHPDDRQVVNEHLLQLIENPDASMRMEVRILLRDGTCRFVEGIGQNMLNDPTVEKASDGIVILDENGRLCYESPSMERLLGLNPEERIGMNAFEFVHPDDIKKAGEAFNKLTKGRVQTVTIEIRGRHRDGSWRILRIVGRNFLDDPKIRGIVANFSDITERKQAEEALKTSEARFRALTLNSLDAIAIIDKEGNLLEQIPATENVLGYEGGKRIGRNAFEFVHPDDLQFVNKSLSLLMRKPGSSRHIEVRARHKDGSWRTLEVTARNLFKDPAVQGIVANYRDITERRQAEEALKEREEHFRALIENSLDAIAILDSSGAAVYVNQSFERVLGVTAADVQGKKWFPWVHPDDLERTTEAFIELMQKHGATAHGEVRVSSNDGSWRTIETVAQNLLHYPAVGGIVANFRDRTELKQAEAELRFQQEYFRSLIENSQEVIVVLDKEGDIQYESPSLETVTGYKPYERIGRSIFEYVHPDDLPGLTEILPKLMQSPRSIMHREFRGKWKDGWHDVEASAQNLLDDPVVKGVVINFRDITERKDAEKKRQEYYEQEKAVRQQLEEEMRRRIEFTRALAHELKTPLTSVLASCDSLIEKLEDEPLLGLARNINRGAVNLNTRIDELLDLARGEIGILEIHASGSGRCCPHIAGRIQYRQ